MAKLTLTDVENLGGNPNAAALAINENSAEVEAAIENTLSRDGTSPNQMEAELDMNSHRIINLAPPENPNDAARLADISEAAAPDGLAPAGGTTDQVLTKNSNADYDYSWQDPPEGGGGGGGTVDAVAPGTGIDVDSTDPANPVVSVEAAIVSGAAAGATAVQPSELTSAIVSNSDAATTAAPADINKYTRFSHASATYTFDDDQGYTEGQEFHGRYVGSGTLTLVAATGFTLNAPAYGSLVIPPQGTFTVKIVSTTVGDVIGLTVPS